MPDNLMAMDALDPLLLAQVEAAQWCQAVMRQGGVVSQARLDLVSALTALENVSVRAARALSDVQAIKTLREAGL